MRRSAPRTGTPPPLPRGVVALGIVSLLMDASSELVHSLLPLFVTGVLGASMVTLGLLEGIAEGTASIVKVFSGTLSDWLGRRKALLLAGYGLGALSKPFFALAPTVGWVFAARFADRVGKGIRGAPRDALVADLVPEAQRGAAYGLRQSLDSVGAVIGPLAALALLAWLAVDLRTAIWVAVIPGIAAVLVIVFFVRDPVPAGAAGAARSVRVPIRFADLRQLGAPFWLIVVLGTVLTLARFSEAFLVLRATDVGLGIVWAPAVMVVMSLVYALVSYPAGIAVDRGHGRALLLWGLAALVAADVVLALATAGSALFAGVALWGIHMGLTQGLLSTLIAAVAPPRLRGTAFGLFNLVTGIALVAASVLAGVLWERLGAAATFWAGAAFTAVALAGLAAWRPAAGTERAGA